MCNLHCKSHPFSSPLKSNSVPPTSSNLNTACMIIPLSMWHVMLCALGINKLCETIETMWSSIATPFIFIQCDQTFIESFFDLEDFNLSTNHPTGWNIYNGNESTYWILPVRMKLLRNPVTIDRERDSRYVGTISFTSVNDLNSVPNKPFAASSPTCNTK